MRSKLRRWWPAAKALLGLAILVLIGRQFAADLARPDLWARPLQPGWLALSGALYLVGLSFSALYWGRLLAHLGQPAPAFTVARAYYVGHLGKYVPGKALSLVMRAALVRGHGVSAGMAGLTSFYEVLVSMTAGACLAAVLFALAGTGTTEAHPGAALSWSALTQLATLQVPEGGVIGRPLAVAVALLLALAVGLPLAPNLFNRLAHRLSLPFRDPASRLPHVRWLYLLEGLALVGCGWLVMGASLWCALRAVLGPLNWTPDALARLPAALAVAYVAGFIILVAPGGIGAREFFLALFLVPGVATLSSADPAEARALVVLTVVALRISWTLAELLLAAALYLVPAPRTLVVGGSP